VPKICTCIVAGFAAIMWSCAGASHTSIRLNSSITARARATNTSYLAISRGPQIVLRLGQPDLHETWSVTKSMCGIALEILKDQGKISSFDAPLRRYFPNWANDARGHITIRQVMDQDSGLELGLAATSQTQGDTVRRALDLKLIRKPGTVFDYNNVATNLLSGVILRASGETPREFLRLELFNELKIKDFAWENDQAGNTPCSIGLAMRGDDLLKLGQVLAGVKAAPPAFNVPRLLDEVGSEHVPDRADYGLLWWKFRTLHQMTLDSTIYQSWKDNGVPESALLALMPMRDHKFTATDYLDEIRRRLGTTNANKFFALLADRGLALGTRTETGPRPWLSALGSGGQYLVIFPDIRGVAIRLSDENEDSADTFIDFPALARKYLSDAASPSRELLKK